MMCGAAGLGPAMARGVFDRFLIVQYSFWGAVRRNAMVWY
jgi:hypothetical protein